MTRDEFYFWTTMSTLLIACCALLLTIWQGYMTRKHNKISIQPIFDSHLSWTNDKLTLTIINCGLGTAHCTEVSYLLDNNVVQKDAFSEYLDSFYKKWRGDKQCHAGWVLNGSHIPKGEKITIVTMDFPKDSDMETIAEEFQSFFDFTISFQCLYGKNYEFKYEKLT